MLHDLWLNHLNDLRWTGTPIGPRGQQTHEALDWKLALLRSESNLLDVPERKLNVRFAVAEWIWMMFGHSAVGPIARYNKVMERFSDDGVWLTGAYGPHIAAQKYRVLRKLTDDPATRQAVITIPRPGVFATKDEPCTTSLQYLLRDGRLHCIVTMRSSDAWLGVPYDVFTFTQIQNCFAGVLGVPRGRFTLNAGSAHLYERDFDAAERCLYEHTLPATLYSPPLPGLPPPWLETVMLNQRLGPMPKLLDSSPWLPYAHALAAPTSDLARRALLEAQAS